MYKLLYKMPICQDVVLPLMTNVSDTAGTLKYVPVVALTRIVTVEVDISIVPVM